MSNIEKNKLTSRRTGLFLAASAVGVCLLPGVVSAHHSFASFDPTKLITIDGELYAVEWSSPHCWVWIAVRNNAGGQDIWALEGAAPASFTREGVTKKDFVKGLKMKVDFHPLRDERKGGQFLRAILADGRVIGSLKTPIDILREQGLVSGPHVQ